MYLLQFLKQAARSESPTIGEVSVEHRLLCSGELFNARVMTADWRKSDVTRVLSRSPFELFVTSRPFDSYPQELCARFRLNYETEKAEAARASFVRSFLPDDEIVEDLCSILTLLARRLIVPVVKTREQHEQEVTALGSFGRDIPLPLTETTAPSWKPRHSVVITRGPREQEVTSYEPPPLAVYPDVLEAFLLKLPSLAEGERIIRAARLYREALELIETRPDSAYQFLISVAETMSNAALPDYAPPRDEILQNERAVREMAIQFGLTQDQADELALAAARGNPWTKRKFRAFLSDRIKPEELLTKDTVFHPLEHLCPATEKFSKALGNVYDLRSGNLHEGKPMPRDTRIGTGPMIKVRDLPLNPLAKPDVPPVVWFERVVSLAVRRFIQYASMGSSPFGDPGMADETEASARSTG